MLAVDRLELLARLLEAPAFEIGEALIVEHVGRLGLLDIGGEIDVVVGRACRQNSGEASDANAIRTLRDRLSSASFRVQRTFEIRPFGASFSAF